MQGKNERKSGVYTLVNEYLEFILNAAATSAVVLGKLLVIKLNHWWQKYFVYQ
jgi:hypothetical protein